MTDTARFRFIADALGGSGIFRPVVAVDASGRATSVSRTALVRYPRESAEKFARRNEVAWYENHLLSACRRFVGYLAKKPPVRDIGHPLLEDFADDCNWRGDSLDVFWQGFMADAKARGSMLLLVDMPDRAPVSLADQVEQRFFPYLVPIRPEEVIRYALDERGRFALVEIAVTWQGKHAVKGWDAERWWVRVGDEEVAGEPHPLGVCPVLAFTESGDYPAIGDFAQIADMSQRLFNVRSELDEILRAQTFSLLTYHVPPEQTGFNAVAVAEAIGTHNMLIHQGGAPGFIAPPDGPARIYLDTIKMLEEAIRRVSLTVETPEENQAESGVALTIRFQALNSALTGFARRMEDLERRVWALACAWLGLPSERVATEWAKDYALSDVRSELETLDAMTLSGFPDEALRAQRKRILGLTFATTPPGEMQSLMDAVDAAGAEAPPPPGDA